MLHGLEVQCKWFKLFPSLNELLCCSGCHQNTFNAFEMFHVSKTSHLFSNSLLNIPTVVVTTNTSVRPLQSAEMPPLVERLVLGVYIFFCYLLFSQFCLSKTLALCKYFVTYRDSSIIKLMINPDAFLRFLSALFYDEILSSSASEKDDRQYYQL